MMPTRQYQIPATVAANQIAGLAHMITNDLAFSHREWSPWQADALATLAAMIREGYAAEESERKEEPMVSPPEQVAHLNDEVAGLTKEVERLRDELDTLVDWIDVNTLVTRPNGSDVSEILDRVTAARKT